MIKKKKKKRRGRRTGKKIRKPLSDKNQVRRRIRLVDPTQAQPVVHPSLRRCSPSSLVTATATVFLHARLVVGGGRLIALTFLTRPCLVVKDTHMADADGFEELEIAEAIRQSVAEASSQPSPQFEPVGIVCMLLDCPCCADDTPRPFLSFIFPFSFSLCGPDKPFGDGVFHAAEGGR